jgi:hypothetical protein
MAINKTQFYSRFKKGATYLCYLLLEKVMAKNKFFLGTNFFLEQFLGHNFLCEFFTNINFPSLKSA